MVLNRIKRYFRKKGARIRDIDPDEIMLDSKNLPDFDVDQFKGRIEKPISMLAIAIFSAIFFLLFIVLATRAWVLEIHEGEAYAMRSENNRLKHQIIFSDRGAIFDRNGEKLVWNTLSPEEGDEFSLRSYIETPGFSHILGFVKYPSKDKNGYYFRKDFEGVEGVEEVYNEELKGEHGLKIIETDALDHVESESTLAPSRTGENLFLSIDARIQEKMYNTIKELSEKVGFTGGAGAIMDVNTGEIYAMVSYPEYSSNVMTDGDSKKIGTYTADGRKPFLNRFTEGLYAPGSTVKPYVALGALAEGVIDPETEILSTGSISVPNPYDPDKKTVFKDWKAHGLVDMRKAIAVSSNVYFYEVGGGFGGQNGLGILRLEKYFSIFGFGTAMDEPMFKGPAGTIPTPEWKEKTFPGDPWRIGDTYYTAIGQYGFQVTPLQELRGVASIANGGFLLTPSIISASTTEDGVRSTRLPFSKEELDIIRDGMRQSVLFGTESGLNVPYIDISGKTGTAELGVSKQHVNSWAVGYFPSENPKYAFTVVMERGPRGNTLGGVYVMRTLFDWMNQYTPEYFE